MLDVWDITIPELTGDEPRKAYCYVPDFFEEDPEMRFPVLYMFDGQNVFVDELASYGVSWNLLEFLEENEVPLIVAAIECNHHGEDEEVGGRISEYSPFDFEDPEFGDIYGRGEITMDYFVNEFKPFIDENYPTISDREHTFIAGSSMGGLMSLFALLYYNEVFSRAAALSPSLLFSPDDIYEMIEESEIDAETTVLYMDYGSQEFSYEPEMPEIYANTTALLIEKGIMLESRIVPYGDHSEKSWSNQLPFFLSTLFYELDL